MTLARADRVERPKRDTAQRLAVDTVYVSGFPPFDPETGKVIEAPIERQAELVLEQMKLASRRRDRL